MLPNQLTKIFAVRRLSPAARTDLLIAAIPFALALAAKGLEALERHIAGRLLHLTELEIAIANAEDVIAEHAPKVHQAEHAGPGLREDQGEDVPEGAVIAHPMGCIRTDEHDPSACIWPAPDAAYVDDEPAEVAVCTEPWCGTLGLHEHPGGIPVVGTPSSVAANARPANFGAASRGGAGAGVAS